MPDSEPTDQMLALAQTKLREQEQAVADTKKFINQLLAFAGRAPLFETTDTPTEAASLALRGDEFVGQTQHTAARMSLERRKAPATLDELHRDLVAGGYEFTAKDDTTAKKGLYNQLVQNSGTFYRIKNGKWGLAAWYPGARKKKPKDGNAKGEDDADGDADDEVESDASDAAAGETEGQPIKP